MPEFEKGLGLFNTSKAKYKPKSPLTPLIRLTNDKTRAPKPKLPSSYKPPSWLDMAVGGQWPYNPISTGDMTLAQYLGTGTGGTPAAGAALPALPAGMDLKNLWDIKWQKADYDVPGGNKPSWWVNLLPKDVKDAERPDVQYLMMLNTMIPYLSPEDQRNAASQLYSTAADAFSYYKPERTPITAPINMETYLASPAAQAAGTPILDEAYYGSKQRAEEARVALSNMREATVKGNRWKLGPGYTWLQSLLGAFTGFGSEAGPGEHERPDQAGPYQGRAGTPGFGIGQPPGTSFKTGEGPFQGGGGGIRGIERDEKGNPIPSNAGQRLTATQMLQILGALDPLLAQGQGLGPFSAIGKMFAQPFATAGQTFGPRQRNRLLSF